MQAQDSEQKHMYVQDTFLDPESGYIECEKSFSIPLSMIGENIFLTREEAEKKLGEVKE